MTTTHQAPGGPAVCPDAARPGPAAEHLPAPPAPVAAVLARMRVVEATLPPADGIAVFNRVYLSVTEEIARRLGAGGFQDSAAAGELDAVFARRYLAAVDAAGAGLTVPACWRPLFQLRRHPGVRPLQFALAGINAHIGHDLALAVVDTCRVLGCEPGALAADFDRVGDLLTGLEERIRESLMPGPDLLDIADPLTHLAGSWSLEMARDGAWAAARVLWSLRGLPETAEEFTERLGSGVGLVGRCLLTPLG
ncbi:DUF5995 family protein [Streptomyces rimosus]|uniref:DUF5995 family protein n=1 Tax=Streptomyces rimosus TaxID=1927 RepID=UPI0022770CA6|nr:DUF5995 family protein [Streptomyces rimosus]